MNIFPLSNLSQLTFGKKCKLKQKRWIKRSVNAAVHQDKAIRIPTGCTLEQVKIYAHRLAKRLPYGLQLKLRKLVEAKELGLKGVPSWVQILEARKAKAKAEKIAIERAAMKEKALKYGLPANASVEQIKAEQIRRQRKHELDILGLPETATKADVDALLKEASRKRRAKEQKLSETASWTEILNAEDRTEKIKERRMKRKSLPIYLKSIDLPENATAWQIIDKLRVLKIGATKFRQDLINS